MSGAGTLSGNKRKLEGQNDKGAASTAGPKDTLEDQNFRYATWKSNSFNKLCELNFIHFLRKFFPFSCSNNRLSNLFNSISMIICDIIIIDINFKINYILDLNISHKCYV